MSSWRNSSVAAAYVIACCGNAWRGGNNVRNGNSVSAKHIGNDNIEKAGRKRGSGDSGGSRAPILSMSGGNDINKYIIMACLVAGKRNNERRSVASKGQCV